jgi:hypothetical protein
LIENANGYCSILFNIGLSIIGQQILRGEFRDSAGKNAGRGFMWS